MLRLWQILLFLREINWVERVKPARERDNDKMGRKSFAETSPRASKASGAKTLAPHELTCLEIATKNPQGEKYT